MIQVKDAMAAVGKLHGQSVSLKAGKPKKGKRKAQPEEAPEGPVAQLWARQVSGEGLHMKKWRVIIRNLGFQVRLVLFSHEPFCFSFTFEGLGSIWYMHLAAC